MTILSAKTCDIRSVHAVLKSIGFAKLAVLQIRDAGLQFTVQSGQEVTAKGYIPRTFFDEYAFKSSEGAVQMEISISSLIETMNIYGNATTTVTNANFTCSEKGEQDVPTVLKLNYQGYGYPLALDIIAPPTILPDDSMWSPQTTVELKTNEYDIASDGALELPFDDESVQMKVIMQSQWLSDALAALETQTDVVTLSSPADTSANAPALRLSAISETGALEFDFPESEQLALRDDGPIDSIVRSVEGVVCERYRAAHILHASKAIAASHKTSLRINSIGMLSLQMMVIDAHGKQTFIDFVLRPLENDDIDML